MAPASSRCGIRRTRLAVAVTLALAGASAAVAADVQVVDGLLQFPNVRVINAPQGAATLTAPQGGMKAYKDSASSELRGPTTEEMQAASATTARRTSASRASAESSDAAGFSSAGGGVGVVLDDSSMQYSVVVRQADGSLKEVCVNGQAAATEVVRQPAVLQSSARKEAPHVR